MTNAKSISRYKGRSVAWLLKKTQEYFNRYIRLRDQEDGYFECISCRETKPIGQIQAGHFRSTGHYGCLRFNEDNCHAQCIKCNMYLGGNLYEYSKALKLKIGSEAFKRIDNGCNGKFKWDRIELIGLLEDYKRKCKEL